MGSSHLLDIDHKMKALINRPASNHFLSHIAHQASLVIACHHNNEHYKSPIPPLPTFVNLLARRSSARTGTLLASLVLLDRLRQRLAQFARGMPCTCQRIFLATLIVTTKLLHDTSPKNKHWTKYAVYFTLPEINLMEKQFLTLMNYQLSITEKDMYYSFIMYDNTTGLQLPPILPDCGDRYYLPKSASFNSTRQLSCNNSTLFSNIVLQQQQQQKQQLHYYKTKCNYFDEDTGVVVKKSKSMTNTSKKRVNIPTSSSSSSLSSTLSSSNSMDDLLVVTPISSSNENNNNSLYHNPTTTAACTKKLLHLNNAPSSLMWLEPIILPHHHHHSSMLFKH